MYLEFGFRLYITLLLHNVENNHLSQRVPSKTSDSHCSLAIS